MYLLSISVSHLFKCCNWKEGHCLLWLLPTGKLRSQISLVALPYSLPTHITMALAWCGIVVKTPKRRWLKGRMKMALSHTFPLAQRVAAGSSSTRLCTARSENVKWWHLLTGSGDVRHALRHRTTIVLMMQSPSLRNCEMNWQGHLQTGWTHCYIPVRIYYSVRRLLLLSHICSCLTQKMRKKCFALILATHKCHLATSATVNYISHFEWLIK